VQPTTASANTVSRDPLVELSAARAVPLAPAISRARATFEGAVADMLAVPDAALERPWLWRPDDPPGETDVRNALYRIVEVLEESVAAIARGRAATRGEATGPAVPRLATATQARWSLHGAIWPLSVGHLDADPGGGEWSVRRTLGHVVQSQRSYGWYSAWYLSRAGRPDAGSLPPDGALPPEPDEATEAPGDAAAIRRRLDGLLDAAAERFAALDDAGLAVPGRWSGLPVTIDFRLGRLGSHIREHTVQVDKTLAMIDRRPTEVERIVRLACESFGRLEAAVFGRPESELVSAFADGATAASVVEGAAGEAARLARSARETASA
jgi:hypothetical protein